MTPSFNQVKGSNRHAPSGKAEHLPISGTRGGKEGGYKLLVTYATGFGTTREVAEEIGQTLRRSGAKVEIKAIGDATDISDYDGLIIGSAIQYDKWMPEAVAWVRTHRAILASRPVAFFFTCLTLSSKSEKAQRQALAYADKLYFLQPLVKPVDVGGFAGVLDYNRLPLVWRLMARILFAILGVKEGDYRDWDAIRSWTRTIHTEFTKLILEIKGEQGNVQQIHSTSNHSRTDRYNFPLAKEYLKRGQP